MKKLCLYLVISTILVGCNNNTREMKEQIQKYIEDRNIFGIQSNLEFGIGNITVKDITVGDSIYKINKHYQPMKESRISIAQESLLKNKQKLQSPHKSLWAKERDSIEYRRAQKYLEEWEEWQPEELEQYKNRDSAEVLVRLVTAEIAITNLSTKKKVIEKADFVFDKKKAICLRYDTKKSVPWEKSWE